MPNRLDRRQPLYTLSPLVRLSRYPTLSFLAFLRPFTHPSYRFHSFSGLYESFFLRASFRLVHLVHHPFFPRSFQRAFRFHLSSFGLTLFRPRRKVYPIQRFTNRFAVFLLFFNFASDKSKSHFSIDRVSRGGGWKKRRDGFELVYHVEIRSEKSSSLSSLSFSFDSHSLFRFLPFLSFACSWRNLHSSPSSSRTTKRTRQGFRVPEYDHGTIVTRLVRVVAA